MYMYLLSQDQEEKFNKPMTFGKT